jgi:hypothetical protein
VVPTWPLRDEPGHGYFFLAPYRSVIAFPTPSGGYRIFCVRDDPDPTHNDPPTLEELRGLVAGASGIRDLRLSLTEPVWLSRARFADRVAPALRRGRVLLAGDAAHSWAPIGGHGMNVGILGAHNLVWKLAAVHRGEAADSLLDSYDIEQRAMAHNVIRDMRRNIMEMLLPPMAHRARAALLRVGIPTNGFQRKSEWMMSDFGRHHRRSPLSWHRAGRGGLRAGDRLPDLMVLADASRLTATRPGAAGATAPADATAPAGAGEPRPVRLHSLLAYDRWTVLVHAAATDARTLAALRDTCARSAAAIKVVPISDTGNGGGKPPGRPQDVLVVRPDGYLGLVARLDQPDTLRDYLATYLRGQRPRPD